jgi:hypothetical protein
MDSLFLSGMEEILGLYALPYDPLYLVVCFDGGRQVNALVF